MERQRGAGEVVVVVEARRQDQSSALSVCLCLCLSLSLSLSLSLALSLVVATSGQAAAGFLLHFLICICRIRAPSSAQVQSLDQEPPVPGSESGSRPGGQESSASPVPRRPFWAVPGWSVPWQRYGRVGANERWSIVDATSRRIVKSAPDRAMACRTTRARGIPFRPGRDGPGLLPLSVPRRQHSRRCMVLGELAGSAGRGPHLAG